MVTLTRKIGQRVLIGPNIEVEVVEVRRSGVVLQLRGVEDESKVQLVDTPLEDHPPRSRPASRRRRMVPSSRQSEPVIVEKRRTRRPS